MTSIVELPPASRPLSVMGVDLAAVKGFILSAQVTAAAYARNYPGTVKELRKANRLMAAFQQVLDDPAAEAALSHPALKPLLDEAGDA